MGREGRALSDVRREVMVWTQVSEGAGGLAERCTWRPGALRRGRACTECRLLFPCPVTLQALLSSLGLSFLLQSEAGSRDAEGPSMPRGEGESMPSLS